MKRKIFALIVALITILLLSTTAFAVNEVEKNNTKDTATNISVNTAVYGNTESGNDSDWYRVTLDKAGAISVQFEHEQISSSNTYWYISLYQSDGSSGIAGSTRYWEIPGDKTSYTTAEVGIAAGTYYVKVEPYSSGRYNSSIYTMKVNYASSAVWEKENNNTIYNATPLSLNTDSYGSIFSGNDQDWYSITIEESGHFSIQFDHDQVSSSNTYWYISLYQSDGSSGITGSTRYWEIPGDKTIYTTAEVGVAAGTYYVKIEPYSSGRYSSSTYTIKANYTSSAVWEKENNNTIYNATSLSLNTDSYGSIFSGNDQDWYSITVEESGHFYIQFDHDQVSSSNTYWYISLYQSDGSSGIAGSTRYWEVAGDKTSFTTSEVGVDAGTYYVKVEPYSSGRFSSIAYTMKINYESSTVWEKENNNTVYTATPLSLNADNYGSIFSGSDQDWFSFEIKTASEVSMSFSHASVDSSNTYWYITVYTDGSGLQRLGDIISISGDNAKILESLGTLSAGTYYIKIEPYSSGRFSGTPYTLRVDEKHDHVYGEWTTTQEPTCTESGIREQSCIVCDNTITEKINPNGHSFGEWEIDEEATCTEKGARHHICEVCGFTEAEAIEKIPHTYGEWTVVKEPTCSVEGLQQHVCSICGEIETEAIEMLPHEFGELHKVSGSIFNAPITSEEVCVNCGYTQTYENYDYKWVMPLLIAMVIVFALLIVALIVYRNRKKIFKTSFVCPYCFETHKMSEVEFRCSNNLCKDVPDLPMTKYENGDSAIPLVGKPTFKSTEVVRGKKFIPRAATCPECHRTTHKVICPSCHNILPESTLLGEDMIISIVGSRDTGKSHFVGVIINELIERVAPAFGGSFEGFDDTMERYEQSFGRKLYVDLQKLDLTQSSLQNVNNGAYRPLIFSLKLQVKKGLKETINRYTLVFFDTAGEDLDDADTMSTVNKYICKSAGIIFLLDPMKIPAVATQLDEDVIKRASSVSWQRAGRSDDILVRVSNLIRNDRSLKSSDKIDVPVAVVFSKFDAIEPIIPQGCAILANSPHCKEKAFVLSDWHNVNSEVQGLLRTWGAESFLSQLEVNYTDYSCFAVSSLGLNNNPTSDMKISRPMPHRIEDPLLWILMKLKVIGSKR